MAESDEGSWWGSWYTTAKNKSAEVLEFVKRDLDEFSTAVKSEASHVVSSTSTVFKDKLKLDEPDSTASSMKRSVSSFLGQVSQALSPSPDDSDQEALVISQSEPIELTKLQIRLHELTLKPETFLCDPDESQMLRFQAWREIQEDQFGIERLTKLLTASPELHRQYTTLVPDQVPHLVFWERFLFLKALLEDEEAQREALKRRSDREKQVAENYQWAQDEELGGSVELTEEEQTRLLLEYQRECESKKTVAPGNDLASNMDDNHYAAAPDQPAAEPKTAEHSNTSSLGESIGEDWEREFDLTDVEVDQQSSSPAAHPADIPQPSSSNA